MKKLLATMVGIGLSCASVYSQTHEIFDGFVVLNPAGAGNTFFDTDEATANPDFTNTVATIEAGQVLLIGGEVESDRDVIDFGGPQEVKADEAAIHYAFDGASAASLDLPHVGGGPIDRWQETNFPLMVDIGSSLAVGIHTLNVYFTATDLNFPAGGPITKTLPATGSFEALVEVTPAPTGVVLACDNASDTAYDAGWTNGSNGGTGFGPWTHQIVTDPDGVAGIFLAVNDSGAADNDGMNFVGTGTPPEGWGLFANEAGTGGDDIQIVGAFRSFDAPLATGQVFTIRFEHGGIQGGSLSANTPPRTGGWVGFTLRTLAPGQFGDPDPIDDFGAIRNAQFGFGFRGGDAEYTLYDVMNPSGTSSGIPFTTNGVEVTFHLTSSTTYDLTVRSLGEGGYCTTIEGRATTGGSIEYVAVYNRNAEEGDVFFNSMKAHDAPLTTTNRLAYDDAAMADYDAGWASGQNGGAGFEPWSFFTNSGAGGVAGHFTATNPPNTDLNGVATEGRGWGMFAKDDTGGGVQVASAFRLFSQGALKRGQAFSVDLEHGGIAALNGQVRLVLYGTPTFVNEDGDVFTFEFLGGGTDYVVTDETLFRQSTGVPWTDAGLHVELRLRDGAAPPYAYDLTITPAGGVKRLYTGTVDSPPKSVRLEIVDVEEADVFWNRLALLPSFTDFDGDDMPNDWELRNGTNPHVDDGAVDTDGDGDPNRAEYIADTAANDSNDFFRVDSLAVMSPPVLSFEAATGRLYTVEYDDDLRSPDDWQVLSNDVAGVAGTLNVSDAASTNQRNYRVRVRLAPGG